MRAHLGWVGIVVRDLDRAIALYTELFDAKFRKVNPYGGPHPVNVNPFAGNPPNRVAIDWDTGIELIMPIPGRDSEYAAFLQERGEGLLGMDFITDDLEEVRRRAERMGITIFRTLQLEHDEIERHGLGNFKRSKTHLLKGSPETCGVRILVTQRDPG